MLPMKVILMPSTTDFEKRGHLHGANKDFENLSTLGNEILAFIEG